MRSTSEPAYRTSTGPEPMAAEVGGASEVGAVVLLELPHAAATSATPTRSVAPPRKCLRL